MKPCEGHRRCVVEGRVPLREHEQLPPDHFIVRNPVPEDLPPLQAGSGTLGLMYEGDRVLRGLVFGTRYRSFPPCQRVHRVSDQMRKRLNLDHRLMLFRGCNLRWTWLQHNKAPDVEAAR